MPNTLNTLWLGKVYSGLGLLGGELLRVAKLLRVLGLKVSFPARSYQLKLKFEQWLKSPDVRGFLLNDGDQIKGQGQGSELALIGGSTSG